MSAVETGPGATLDCKAVLGALVGGRDLGRSTMEQVFGAIMDGLLEPAQVAALLVALRMKGETGVEVAAAAHVMRQRATRIEHADPDGAVDTCGTGGDGGSTLNISTAAALVAAAAGVTVAKHGNRSVSSRCGSADVLEGSGVHLALPPAALGTLLDELGIAFLFAPSLHPAMRAVMPVRRSLAIRTTFNLLGPLTNPAKVRRQVMGVWGPEVQQLAAEALAELGAVHALVVHSDDGLDELSVAAPTRIIEVRDGAVVADHRVDPAGLGIRHQDVATIAGGDVEHNIHRLTEILGGGEHSAASEAVALNAGAALMVAGRAPDLAAGLEAAREILHSGAAAERLAGLARRSTELAVDA